MLAGGTQMCTILSILKCMKVKTNKIIIGTTNYILNDTYADFKNLVFSIDRECRNSGFDLHLNESTKPGLRAYADGFVKEGVGAGGPSIATLINANGKLKEKLC